MALATSTSVSFLGSKQSVFRGSVKPVAHPQRRLVQKPAIRAHTAVPVRAFQVTFKTPDGDQSIECDGDTYLLDAADENELDMPYSCRAGSCATCLGKLVSGEVDQSEGTFLDEDQQKDGWVLTCISYPKGDVTIASHKEGEM
ncbi:hypothetical protein WJX74_007431 [Apatococcus lobatus]|uniref:Ferredoxin n=1 Tax=Apatococcus lobatus TaxID=904363 RepID=A0AAW1SAP4_9CHLO